MSMLPEKVHGTVVSIAPTVKNKENFCERICRLHRENIEVQEKELLKNWVFSFLQIRSKR